jgi:hypothetical protein
MTVCKVWPTRLTNSCWLAVQPHLRECYESASVTVVEAEAERPADSHRA